MTASWDDQVKKDIGSVLIKARSIQRRVRELAGLITQDYQGRKPHVIAILKGAAIFHADLVRSVNLAVSIDFMAVESYGNSTRTSGEVRILKDLDESIKGKDVLLVEDIVDTGLTLQYLMKNLTARAPRSMKVVSLLNKPSRRALEIRANYVGFDIPDRFVVGYGLDLNGRYRNLPDIWALKS